MTLSQLSKLSRMTVSQMSRYKGFKSVQALPLDTGFTELARPTHRERWELTPDNIYRLVAIF